MYHYDTAGIDEVIEAIRPKHDVIAAWLEACRRPALALTFSESTHIEALHQKWMQNPAYRAEYEALEAEFAAAVERGRDDARAGRVTTHEEMEAELNRIDEGITEGK